MIVLRFKSTNIKLIPKTLVSYTVLYLGLSKSIFKVNFMEINHKAKIDFRSRMINKYSLVVVLDPARLFNTIY